MILHRRLHDPATKDYIARRVAEGKTRRDAVRLLKRYLARHLYRVLNQRATHDLTVIGASFPNSMSGSYQVTLDGLWTAAATQRWQVSPRRHAGIESAAADPSLRQQPDTTTRA